MDPEIGTDYTRAQIAGFVGVDASQDGYAVLEVNDQAVAIVVRQDGLHPNKVDVFVNALSPTEFWMGGRNDRKGALLESAPGPLQLYFSHENNDFYRYEGWVEYATTNTLPGGPMRVFNRVQAG